MGVDASHRGDSSQHTAPPPAPAVLPSDTPIAPTAEQVNSPGQRHVLLSSPHVGWGGCQCGNDRRRASSQSSQQPHRCVFPVWEMRLREVHRRAQSPTAHQTVLGFKLKSLTPRRLRPVPRRLSSRVLGGARQAAPGKGGAQPAASPATAAPLSVCGLLVRLHVNRGSD